MKKFFMLAAMFVVALTSTAQTVDGRNFGIDGFAAYAGTPGTNQYLAGGTTGGAGGEVVKAETLTQLQAYLQSSKPYIVLVDRDITPSVTAYVDGYDTGVLCDKQDGSEGVAVTYGERIMIAPNKTLIGIANSKGEAPLFTRITFVMQCCSNVIIRNCRFTMNSAPVMKGDKELKIVAWRDGAQVQVGDPDCIGIQADKNNAKTDWGAHIWIDHCEFFNGNAAKKDRYDGLLDCKNNVQWMTFSYNFFHNHDKACLFGKSASDVYENCRTISFHHNYFKDIPGSRLPLQRGGYLHYMNNYHNACESGWELDPKAIGYVDACYFLNSKAPILPNTGNEQKLTINTAEGYGIIYDNCKRIIVNPSDNITYLNQIKRDAEYDLVAGGVLGTWKPEQTWANYFVNNHDKAVDVPSICEKYSGAGKIVVWNEAIPAVDLNKLNEALATQVNASCYDEKGNKITHIDTGINNITTTKADNHTVKYMKNGRIVIEKDGKRFTTTGVQIR